MTTSIKKPAVTILTTDPTVFPILKAKLTQKSENYQVHAHFFSHVNRVQEVISKLKQAETFGENNHRVIWALREDEMSIVKDILSFHKASIITTNNKDLELDFINALHHYPYIAQPFQSIILKQISKAYKPEHTLSLDLTSYNQLNETEKEVITHMYEGKTTAEIAASVCISYHTVNNSFASIKKKLKVTSKVEIIKHIIKTNQQVQLRQKEREKISQTI